MKLIVISSSSIIENEAQLITSLFEAGLKSFHLRKNKISTLRMKNIIRQIPKHFHDRITIHSHHNLAFDFNLKGIHLTSKHKKNKLKTLLTIRLLQLKKPSLEITTSFKTLGELYESKHQYNYDYVFLSPVFDSNTSKFQGGFSEYSLKAAIDKTRWNVIARGGINIQNIEQAPQVGFKGVAFYSALWTSPNPVLKFNKIINQFKELDIPID
jgi:thiamine-phosphate pyrophosphorylase